MVSLLRNFRINCAFLYYIKVSNITNRSKLIKMIAHMRGLSFLSTHVKISFLSSWVKKSYLIAILSL